MTKIYRQLTLNNIFILFSLPGYELISWKAEQDKVNLIDAGYSEQFLTLADGGK